MKSGKNPTPRNGKTVHFDFKYKIEKYSDLPKVNTLLKRDFFEVVSNRKSERDFNGVTFQQISNVLWHSAKVKNVFLSETKLFLSHRASPSAGGVHPIDIFISLPTELSQREICYYDPYTHRLGHLKSNREETMAFLSLVNDCVKLDNSILFWFVSHPDRNAVHYENGESLVWRDAGALIMLIQLVTKALNMKSCPIGTLGEPFLSNSFSNKLFSAGGLVIG